MRPEQIEQDIIDIEENLNTFAAKLTPEEITLVMICIKNFFNWLVIPHGPCKFNI